MLQQAEQLLHGQCDLIDGEFGAQPIQNGADDAPCTLHTKESQRSEVQNNDQAVSLIVSLLSQRHLHDLQCTSQAELVIDTVATNRMLT